MQRRWPQEQSVVTRAAILRNAAAPDARVKIYPWILGDDSAGDNSRSQQPSHAIEGGGGKWRWSHAGVKFKVNNIIRLHGRAVYRQFAADISLVHRWPQKRRPARSSTNRQAHRRRKGNNPERTQAINMRSRRLPSATALSQRRWRQHQEDYNNQHRQGRSQVDKGAERLLVLLTDERR